MVKIGEISRKASSFISPVAFCKSAPLVPLAEIHQWKQFKEPGAMSGRGVSLNGVITRNATRPAVLVRTGLDVFQESGRYEVQSDKATLR